MKTPMDSSEDTFLKEQALRRLIKNSCKSYRINSTTDLVKYWGIIRHKKWWISNEKNYIWIPNFLIRFVALQPWIQLKLKRENEDFNQNFEYKILIDNKEFTRLKNGEEKIIEIEENAQYLEVKINSGFSEKLSIENLSSDQKIKISGNRFRNKYFKYSGALLPLIGLPFILNDDKTIKTISAILFAIYILFILYIGIFQKRKWINLRLINWERKRITTTAHRK